MKIEELEKSLKRTKALFPNRRIVVVINKSDLEDGDSSFFERLREQDINYLTTEKYKTRICLMESNRIRTRHEEE